MVQAIAQSLSTKLLFHHLFQFFGQLFILKNIQDPFLKVPSLIMEAQRSRLHLLNTVQEILVGIGAYPRVIADIKAEVERRNIFWSPTAHKIHLLTHSCQLAYRL